MRNKEYIVDTIYRDKSTNKFLYLTVVGKERKFDKDYILSQLSKGKQFRNIIIDKNGIVKSKPNSNVKIIKLEKKEENSKKSLESFRNNKIYDGNSEKYGVTINNIDYLVKLPKHTGDTSVISEYVASKFMCYLGYNVHKVTLWKEKNDLVVLLKDFTSNGFVLRSFGDIHESSVDTELKNKEYTYDDVLDILSKNNKMDNHMKSFVIEQFWDMYMLDAILGNRDRHSGNWGYLTNGSISKIAPIYDNGGSLFPDVSSKLDEYKKNRKLFLYERCEKFPASLLCVYSNNEHRYKRTNYYAIVGMHQAYPEMTKSYYKIKLFGEEKIYQIIRNICNHKFIDKTLGNFLVDIVCIRYMHIILRLSFDESYRRLIELCQK